MPSARTFSSLFTLPNLGTSWCAFPINLQHKTQLKRWTYSHLHCTSIQGRALVRGILRSKIIYLRSHGVNHTFGELQTFWVTLAHALGAPKGVGSEQLAHSACYCVSARHITGLLWLCWNTGVLRRTRPIHLKIDSDCIAEKTKKHWQVSSLSWLSPLFHEC